MIQNNIPNGNESGAGDAPTHGSKKLTLEKIYQKKTQLEHILLRPDTYIGSVTTLTELNWIFDEEKNLMVKKEITYVPGLYKIFDEILVNAADNKQRDPKMSQIKIDISVENNTISVYNNGQGIPVEKHKEENMYIPTMIFGHLLTSSNYDDEEEKVTGGRNGFGAKLCNIFSTKFTVETASAEYARAFKQTWEDNMSKAGEAKVKDYMGKDFTRVTFCPDLSKFGDMEKLDDDIVALMTRRAYDVAASAGVTVILNGRKLPINSFKDYINLFLSKDDEDAPKIAFEKVNERWQVGITLSKNEFQQVSFVNSVATKKGRHVDHVVEPLAKFLAEKASKKHKKSVIKPPEVKKHMFIFINCLIVNPSYDSQTKENMTLQPKKFGSKCNFKDAFLKQIEKRLQIVDAAILTAISNEEKKMVKSSAGKKQTKLKGIPKLEDANYAGSPKSLDCTLILTEGDSAKTLAVAGLGALGTSGKNNFGVFPLRGKLLNVREATSKQIQDNVEINYVVKILGLQYKKKYESREDLKSLRYGKLMIMTDQDQDGSHIKGLLINFIHHNWPTLLQLPFLEEFITPIVKARKGKEVVPFFSLPEFEEWKKEKSNWHTYMIKYYKGLGTSTSKEAKEYFNDMSRHRIRFKYSGPNDDTNITMAFSKKCVEQRKEWLTQWMESVKQRREMGLREDYLYEKETKVVNFSDFVNKELVLFSNSDNERSIPNLMDGFKPGQRKVLFTCLKRNDKREVKVAQLAGSVAEHSAYHHGEVSLMGTIVNLAQNFVGSNNLNLLKPIGQFGTRLTGGKDQASPRYINTKLSALAKYIFHPNDEPLLTHQYDDNQKIEPVYYVPIIPMILVNGAEGIGTGWSTKIPNHNPFDIVNNLRRMLDGEEPLPMDPWYKNFTGIIQPYGASKYISFGEIAVANGQQGKDERRVVIKDLPVGVWTENYKANVLDVMADAKPGTTGMISNYTDYNTDTTVLFIVNMTTEKFLKAEEEGLHKFFKLQTTLHTSGMVAFDAECCIRKFDTAILILKEYYKVRLQYYLKRKQYLEGLLQADSRKLSNQARFILEKCNGELTIENKKKALMVQELRRRGYDYDPVRAWKMVQNKEETLNEETENADDSQTEDDDGTESKQKYDYLLGMTMWSLTLEKKEELLKKRDDKLQEYETLKNKSPSCLWREDLDAFLEKLKEVEEDERKDVSDVAEVSKAKKAHSKSDQEVRVLVENAVRIIPKLDAESLKKLERAEKPKVKRVKKTDLIDDEKDEFDDLIDKPTKSLKERLGNSPEQIEKKLQAKRKSLKQTKLTQKTSTKKKRRNSDSESDPEGVLPREEHTPPERTSSRRAGASKVKYFSDESEVEWDVSDSELPAKSTKPTKPTLTKQDVVQRDTDEVIAVSETDSEFEPDIRTSGGSDAIFDSLLAGDDTNPKPVNDTPPKKAPAKKSVAAERKKSGPKRLKIDDSFSDEDILPKKGRKQLDEEFEKMNKPTRRTAKPAKYTVSDSDFSD